MKMICPLDIFYVFLWFFMANSHARLENINILNEGDIIQNQTHKQYPHFYNIYLTSFDNIQIEDEKNSIYI